MRGKVEEQNPQRFTDLISVFQKGMWDLLDDFIRQRKGKEKKKKKGKLWLFSKVELLIFSACSFSIFVLLSTKSNVILSSVATLPKDKLVMEVINLYSRTH